MADDLAVATPDLAFAINRTANQSLQFTIDDMAEDVALSINDVALLVDSLAVERGQILLYHLLLWNLVRLDPALDITVFVDNLTILVDRTTNQFLRVTFNDSSNDVALVILHEAIFDNDKAFQTSEDAFWLLFSLVRRDKFASTNNFAGIVPDLAFPVDLLACKLFGVTLNETTDWHALRSDDIAGLVHGKALQLRQIYLDLFRNLLFGLMVPFSM